MIIPLLSLLLDLYHSFYGLKFKICVVPVWYYKHIFANENKLVGGSCIMVLFGNCLLCFCLQVVTAKVIRNKQTGQSDGYGFIEFVSHAAAERVLQTYNGTAMPNGAQNFRLNWASAGEKRSDDTPDFTIFVGDLASDVTDYMLQDAFKARFSSVKGAKVVIDRITGRTKGYGFVRFGDETEQLRAMTEMNGVLFSTRPMRIGPAANKNAVGGQQFTKGMSLNGVCTHM